MMNEDYHNSAYLTMMREQKTIDKLQSEFHDDYPAVVYGELSEKLAVLSLEYYNEAARNNQEAEYNFINSKCCCTYRLNGAGMRWFHLNFIACTESKAEEFLFFAEVKFVYYTRLAEVIHCQILGPASDVAPRLDGCFGCDLTSIRSEIVHPISGVKSRAQFLAR